MTQPASREPRSGEEERLLDAIRAYGDARADVAYGRATRKAIDRAWDQMLDTARILPLAATPSSGPDLREAALNVVTEWDRYVEAHAGRGHDGPHDEEKALGGDCGACAGAQYGTEVTMAEYAIPALRAALVSHTPDGG